MKVERFFHIRPSGKTHGGACVRVVGDTDRPHQVDVQSVVCSRKDPYNKKVGRTMAAERTVKVVPLRYLPQELARIEQATGKVVHDKLMKQFPNDYTFAIKYFLPKE